MSPRIVRSLKDSSGHRRVDIIRRDDGTFTFKEWRFSEHPYEHCWIPENQRMITITESADAAEREARARVDWLIAEGDNGG